MTWTVKPRDDIFRDLCKDAMAARALVHEAAPVIINADSLLPLDYQDERIRVGRHNDWTDEDWWHMLALTLAAFLAAFAGTVILVEAIR